MVEVDSLETTWEFPKIRSTLFWGPYNEDPTVWGTILGPLFSETSTSEVEAGNPSNLHRPVRQKSL